MLKLKDKLIQICYKLQSLPSIAFSALILLKNKEKGEDIFWCFCAYYRFLSISTAMATAMATAIIIAIAAPTMVMV